MEVNELIKKRRKQLGLSAEAVAEKVHVSPATMYSYENGDVKKIPIQVIKDLSVVLQFKLDQLDYLQNAKKQKKEVKAMDNLEFVVKKEKKVSVRLPYRKVTINDCAAEILDDLKDKTGLTYSELAEAMIEYASKHVKIKKVFVDVKEE